MNRIKTLILTTTAAAVMFSTSLTAFANSDDKFTEADMNTLNWSEYQSQWENIKNDWTKISLTPGRNASELNFCWYSKTSESGTPKIKIAKKSEMNNGAFPDNAKVFTGTTSSAVEGYNSNKVTASGFEENTEYVYSYSLSNDFTTTYSYTTKSTKDFKFLYVGDPQIGASISNISSIDGNKLGEERACRNDSYNWNNTLACALSNNPDISFLLSAGDQINTSDKSNALSSSNEIEYASFLSPSFLRSLPIASTIGNHDSKNSNYSFHFNNPNASNLGSTAAGGDYYYTFGNALFITLNSNNTNTAEHDEIIKKAISENPNAKWRILTFHHDIYGTGAPHSESDGKALRETFSKIIDDNNIDVVLQGHDHTYSRTFQLANDTIQDVTYENGKAINPKGTLYMTANSATGSKYYELYPTQQSYIAARWQEDVPTYSTVEVNDVSFTINTYRTDNNEKIDNSYTIVKSVNKDSLQDLIKEADKIEKDKYTSDSYENMVNKLNSAKETAIKNDADTDEVNEAYADLKEAINNLKKNSNESASALDSNNASKENSSSISQNTSTTNTSSIKKDNSAKTADSLNMSKFAALISLIAITLGAAGTTLYLKHNSKKI